MFGLPERLRYKQKRGMNVAERREGLRRLDGLLGRLAAADPPLHAAAVNVSSEDRGRALKDIEDRLDARFCAWVAAVWFRHGTDRIRLSGDAETGHIAVPMGRFVAGSWGS